VTSTSHAHSKTKIFQKKQYLAEPQAQLAQTSNESMNERGFHSRFG